MSSSRVGEFSLSQRLHKMSAFYSGETHVWDIGCDHGLLGLSFLTHEKVGMINLVDSSEDVINNLKTIIDSDIPTGKVFIKYSKGQNLKIDNKGNCIFIAGMGGKEIGEIIRHLLPQLDSRSRFVISPHRKILELRALLRTLNIHLKSESLVFENHQYYQILVLAPGEGRPISRFGEDFWDSPLGRGYLEHQKRHFSLHRDELSEAYVTHLLSL